MKVASVSSSLIKTITFSSSKNVKFARQLWKWVWESTTDSQLNCRSDGKGRNSLNQLWWWSIKSSYGLILMPLRNGKRLKHQLITQRSPQGTGSPHPLWNVPFQLSFTRVRFRWERFYMWEILKGREKKNRADWVFCQGTEITKYSATTAWSPCCFVVFLTSELSAPFCSALPK